MTQLSYKDLAKRTTTWENFTQKLSDTASSVKGVYNKVDDLFQEYRKPIIYTWIGICLVGAAFTGGLSAVGLSTAAAAVPIVEISNNRKPDPIQPSKDKSLPSNSTTNTTTTTYPYTQPAVNVPIYDQKYVFPNSPLPLTAITATDLSRPPGYGLTTKYPQTSSLHNTPQYQSLMANMDMTAIYQAPVIQNSMDLSSVGQAIKRTTSESKVPLGTLVKQATKDTLQKATNYLFKNTKALHKQVDPNNKLNTHVIQPVASTTLKIISSPTFNGYMQALGGATEVAIGGGLTLVSGGLAAPLGGFLIFHGSDHFYNGARAALSGQESQTATNQLLQKAGVSKQNAGIVDNIMGIGGSLYAAGIMRAARFVSLSASHIGYVSSNFSKVESSIASKNIIPKSLNKYFERPTEALQKHLKGWFREDTLVQIKKINGEELSAREMFKLKQSGELKGALKKAKQTYQIRKDSFDKIVQQYGKMPMPENQAKMLIEKCGFPTFERPSGIPKDWVVRLSDKNGGIIYMHPYKSDVFVRIMPPNPNGYPTQQVTYVSDMRHGMAVDKFGNKLSATKPEAHIPLKEYIYKEK